MLEHDGARWRAAATLLYRIVNVITLDVSEGVLLPPPYGPPGVLLPGFVTETCAVPAEAMSAAGIITLSAFAIGWVVLDCAEPFQFTTAFALNWVPVTVNMKSDPP